MIATNRIFRSNLIYLAESAKLNLVFFLISLNRTYVFRNRSLLPEIVCATYFFQFIYLPLRSASPIGAHVLRFNVFLICIRLFLSILPLLKSKCRLSTGSHCKSLLIPQEFKSLEKLWRKKNRGDEYLTLIFVALH